jgi:putative colanic acid biosynthesis acetyltransferase WcaF
MDSKPPVQLKKKFDTKDFDHGASTFKQLLWYFTSALFFRSGLVPFSVVLVWLLKLFGAKIGQDVRVKPYIHIKFPWKLELGDHSWLAECYIENLAPVIIGKNCCVSQNATLMTGNHNYNSENFDLITKAIILEDGAWVGANAIVCPGVTLKSHAVLAVASVATKDLEAYSIYQGNPAVKVRERIINEGIME